LLEAMPPYQGGGEMISSVTFEKTTYADLPFKFEAGTPNIADAIAFGAAIDYVTALGLDRIAAHEHGLLAYATEKLAALNDVTPDTNWDAHQGLDINHRANTQVVDKPIAGLLTDLKARGLLDTTLVVWTSEFGRTPYGQTGDGRDHNPWGYTSWMAGGGIKPGTYGATDEIGLRAQEGVVDTYDIQATVLNQLGLDFQKLTFQHQGRTEKATTVFGDVIKPILT